MAKNDTPKFYTYYTDEHVRVELPNMIEIQKSSYKWLFEQGIRELLDEITPVDDFTGEAMNLDFGTYTLGEPKVD